MLKGPKSRYHTQVRVLPGLWEKLRIIAERDRRSTNAQLELVLEEYISAYEAQYGEIEVPEKE